MDIKWKRKSFKVLCCLNAEIGEEFNYSREKKGWKDDEEVEHKKKVNEKSHKQDQGKMESLNTHTV